MRSRGAVAWLRTLAPAAAVFAATILGAAGLASGGGASGHAGSATSTRAAASELASGCFTIEQRPSGREIAVEGEGYRAAATGGTAFHLKPTRLGAYMARDDEGRLLGADEDAATRLEDPGVEAEWRIRDGRRRAMTIKSTATGRPLVVARTGRLALAPRAADGDRFVFVARGGCRRYPEAEVGAFGAPAPPTRPDGTVFGFADIHLHVTANLRAGGRVIHGRPFHRFGISEALGHDARDHGPEGTLDVTGNLLREGSPVGTHDTHGWPTFVGWPVHDTITHQQAYYVWLERAWRAGLRLIVAQAVEDEPMCRLEPLRSHSCDETATVRLAVRQLNRLERYIDAQNGGRGEGWFRLVTNPDRARRVIEDGKLAVVIGMETSSPLGCSEFLRRPQCTRAEADRVLRSLHRIGVRSVFVAHWIDNAFGGAALQSGAQGDFIETFEVTQTGHPFVTEPCSGADEAEGRCNSRGLTEMGRYLIGRMMDLHMLIEMDHLSQRARRAVFAMAERRDYPLVSSHTGTGGEWTAPQLARLYGLGGLAAATPEIAPDLIEKIRALRSGSGRAGAAVAFGSDTGGFASFPGPRETGPPLTYPFRAHGGEIRFERQRTGRRVYDLNTDGVAHYGLFADLLADVGLHAGGERALDTLYGSADAYLRMWERTYR